MSVFFRSSMLRADGDNKANEGQRKKRQSGQSVSTGRMEGEELHNSARMGAVPVTGNQKFETLGETRVEVGSTANKIIAELLGVCPEKVTFLADGKSRKRARVDPVVRSKVRKVVFIGTKLQQAQFRCREWRHWFACYKAGKGRDELLCDNLMQYEDLPESEWQVAHEADACGSYRFITTLFASPAEDVARLDRDMDAGEYWAVVPQLASRNMFEALSQLNGNNGEWTNGDDMAGKKGQQRKSKQVRIVVQAPAKKVKKTPRAKKIAGSRVVAGGGIGAGTGLSMCATKYATAIASPWDPMAQGCCIPTFPSRPSQKSTAWTRTTVTIGTGGVGFVALAPSLSNNSVSLFKTDNTYGGTTIAYPAIGVSALSANTPWNAASLTGTGILPAAISGRLVSFGLSWQYTGTVLNQGGLNYALVEPNHGNMENFALGNMGAYQECSITRTVSKKEWLTGSGIDAQEVQYPEINYSATGTQSNSAIYPFSQNMGQSSSYNLGGMIAAVMFTGVPGNTFEVELVQHMEYIGAATSTMATPTHSDARGFEMVNTASNRLAQLRVTHPSAPTMALMSHALKEVAGELKPYAMAGVKMLGATALTALGSALAGPAGGAAGAGMARIMY